MKNMGKFHALNNAIVSSTAVVVLAAAVLFFLDGSGRKNRVVGPAGPMTSGAACTVQVDDPPQAYRIWKERGYRGRIIIYAADTWPSFRPSELNVVPMSRSYPLQLFNPAHRHEETDLNDATFLYVASANGIARKIVALLSDEGFSRMKVAAKERKDSRLGASGLTITHEGFPRVFTTGAGFAGVKEPSLLYVGASYFRTTDPGDLYRQLSSQGLVTDCVILCRESGNKSVTPAELAKMETFSKMIHRGSSPGCPSPRPVHLPGSRSSGGSVS